MGFRETYSLIHRRLFDPRLKRDLKAFNYASDGYVHYGIQVLEDLGLIDQLETGIALEDVENVEHDRMFEHLLDFLVGEEVLAHSDGVYSINDKESPFTYQKLRFLEEYYPYSVEWNDFLVARAEETLIEGMDYESAGFSDDRFLNVWDGMMDEAPFSAKKIMVDFLLRDIEPGDRVLDVGAGTGSVLELILNRVNTSVELAGTDQSEEALEIAAARMRKVAELNEDSLLQQNADNVYLEQYDILQEPPFEEEFDYVTTSLVFNHISAEDRKTALQHLKDMLAPGGKVGVYQLTHNSKFDRVPIWVIHAIPTHVDYPFKEEFIKDCKEVFSNVETYVDGDIVLAEK